MSPGQHVCKPKPFCRRKPPWLMSRISQIEAAIERQTDQDSIDADPARSPSTRANEGIPNASG